MTRSLALSSVLLSCPIAGPGGAPCDAFAFGSVDELTAHIVSGAHVYGPAPLTVRDAVVASVVVADPTFPTGGTGARVAHGPAAPVTVPTAADVDALCRSIGRKFTDADMTRGLEVFAATWLAASTSDFAFLVDMRAKRSLSVGQARGVLNCYRADVFRRPAADVVAPAAIVAPVAPVVAPDALEVGRVYLASGARFVRVYRNQARGTLYGKFRADGGGWDYDGGALRAILPEQDPAAVAAAAAGWAHEYGACVFCATPLEDDKTGHSVTRGYGPVCAGKYGLPWG